MKAGNSNQQVHVLMVGNSTEDFIRFTVKLVRSSEVDYVLCANIYSAVSQLAKNRWCKVLVIGRFENLNKENGWIFRNIEDGKFSCCCLVEPDSAVNWRHVASVRRSGVCIINEMEEVETVIMDMLRDALVSMLRIGKVNQAVFNEEKFTTTKAEMDALLGT